MRWGKNQIFIPTRHPLEDKVLTPHSLTTSIPKLHPSSGLWHPDRCSWAFVAVTPPPHTHTLECSCAGQDVQVGEISISVGADMCGLRIVVSEGLKAPHVCSCFLAVVRILSCSCTHPFSVSFCPSCNISLHSSFTLPLCLPITAWPVRSCVQPSLPRLACHTRWSLIRIHMLHTCTGEHVHEHV